MFETIDLVNLVLLGVSLGHPWFFDEFFWHFFWKILTIFLMIFFEEFSDDFFWQFFWQIFLTNLLTNFLTDCMTNFLTIFLTYNLLTIASFRIGVPSILFQYKLLRDKIWLSKYNFKKTFALILMYVLAH